MKQQEGRLFRNVVIIEMYSTQSNMFRCTRIFMLFKCERSEPEKIEIELLRGELCYNLMRGKRAGQI